MSPQSLATWLGVAPNTVRGWCSSERFGLFLSSLARGGDDKRRRFDERDQRIIAHIVRLKAEGFDEESIALALQQLQADDWRDLPLMPPATTQRRGTTAQDESAMQLHARVQALLQEMTALQKRIESLEGLREVDRDRIIDLERQLAEKDVMLRLYESGRLKPTDKAE